MGNAFGFTSTSHQADPIAFRIVCIGRGEIPIKACSNLQAMRPFGGRLTVVSTITIYTTCQRTL